jgi:hypothetical protein
MRVKLAIFAVIALGGLAVIALFRPESRQAAVPIAETESEADSAAANLPAGGEGPVSVMSEVAFTGIGEHVAYGRVKLLRQNDQYTLQLQEDFELSSGGKLTIFLGNNQRFDQSAKIGSLKSRSGLQDFSIPPPIDPVKYGQVIIVDDASGRPVAVAELTNP